MNPDCIFCKIVSGQIPAKKLYEDDQVLAFHDVQAQAPTHFLVIPKQHLDSLAQTAEEHAPLLGRLTSTAVQVAATQKLSEGYRVVINTGSHGGQTVPHLHLHVLGGRKLGWPPG